MTHFPPPPPGPFDNASYGAPVPQGYDVMAAVKYGWAKFSQNAGTFVVLGLLAFLVPLAIQFVGQLVQGGAGFAGDELDGSGGFAVATGGGIAGFAFSLAANVVGLFFNAALVRAALDAAEGRRADIAEAFTRWDKLQVIVLALLVGLMTTVGLILCVLPGIVVMFFTWFATYFVVAGAGATDAIGSSFRFTADHFGNVFLLFLLCVVITIAGACAFCVGLLVAVPVTVIASAYTFKVLQGQPVAP